MYFFVSMKKMDFPDDVLAIIREYARPRMKFIHEYNQIARLLGFEWSAVKKKLAGPDAEKVLDQFAYYAEAVVTTRYAKEAIPVLSSDYTCSDHLKWLHASRHYSAHLEVVRLRLQRLEWILSFKTLPKV